MCFSGSGPTHFFRSWVRIGIGPTHFLRWIVYYCVCIQHGIDKSQISFIELCKTLRTNSGLRPINSCLHLFWPKLCNRNICTVSYVYACVSEQNLKFSFHQQTVEFGPTHILHRSTPLPLAFPSVQDVGPHCGSGSGAAHMHPVDCLMTNNFLWLLPIKRMFLWYGLFVIHCPGRKDLEHTICSPFAGNCRPKLKVLPEIYRE